MAPLSLKIVLDDGAVTRTMKFDAGTKVSTALAAVEEKMMMASTGKEYGLFLTSTDDFRTGIWLEGHKKLDFYILKDGDTIHYICRKQKLRVKMLDGTVKTLEVEHARPIKDIMLNICSHIGISNHDEYGLCRMTEDKPEETKPATGTLTLKRVTLAREKDAKLEQLSKKFKTDDNVNWLDQHRTLREEAVDPSETLLLKRRLYFSDRQVDTRDPVQLNLLYVQTRDAILDGRHPVTSEQAQCCKSRWVNIRDMMRRRIRERLRNPNNKNKYNYKYEDQLSFLFPFFPQDISEISSRRTEDFEVYYEDENPIDPVFVQGDSDTETKHAIGVKVTGEGHKDMDSYIDSSTDPIDVFLMSIGSTLKKLNPYYLNQAKSKIFQVVQDYELQQIVNKDEQQAGGSR